MCLKRFSYKTRCVIVLYFYIFSYCIRNTYIKLLLILLKKHFILDYYLKRFYKTNIFILLKLKKTIEEEQLVSIYK